MRRLAAVALLALTSAILGPLVLMLIAACWLWTAVLAAALSFLTVCKSRQSGARSRPLSDGGRARQASRAS